MCWSRAGSTCGSSDASQADGSWCWRIDSGIGPEGPPCLAQGAGKRAQPARPSPGWASSARPAPAGATVRRRAGRARSVSHGRPCRGLMAGARSQGLPSAAPWAKDGCPCRGKKQRRFTLTTDHLGCGRSPRRGLRDSCGPLPVEATQRPTQVGCTPERRAREIALALCPDGGTLVTGLHGTAPGRSGTRFPNEASIGNPCDKRAGRG